jgi:tetratricopeptide (TPR) repeat protein
MPNHIIALSERWVRLVACWLGLAGVLAAATHAAAADSIAQTQQKFLHGDYETVISVADKEVRAGAYSDEWRVLLVKALLATGQYSQARSNALAAVDQFPDNLQLRLLAREADFYQNDAADARRQLAQVRLLIERHFGDFQNDDATALGRTLLLLGVEPRLVLDNCFRRAENADPPMREAFLATGDLALEKHDFALAAESFRAGLKKFPADADMECGLARAYAPSDSDETGQHIEAALAANPHHVPTLLLLADHKIDAEDYAGAQEELTRALKVNPHCPPALAYRAVLALLRNDEAAARKDRDDALASWPSNPEVDYLIGKQLARHYRFEEAAAEQQRALDRDSAYLPAQRELAEDLLRLGREKDGWNLAQSAHKQDNYDVTLYNLVTLHDQMEKYQTLSNADFILRLSAREAPLYGQRALELLERAKETLCRKYGVELTRPTQVEIFPEQKDFAVRTFGMPGNPGYLGVCFGSVITANSPASQSPNPANWEDVLWHEFCHVVTLTATANRMPRWLSEGISVYEERQADPTWGERMTLAYRQIILSGKLTPIGELSGAFLAPKSNQALLFAYYESSLVVEFIVREHGLESLKAILKELRDGREINQAIAAHTGPLAELEKRFDAFARKQANELAPGVDLEKPPADDNAAWNGAHPDNYYLRFRQARKLMDETNWAAARPVLQSLAASYSGERRADNPLWLLAVTERNLRDTNAELATLRQLSRRESDFVDMYLRLIELSLAGKDWASATNDAARLLAVNPLIAAPYSALAEAGAALGANDLAIDASRKLLLLDPPDPAMAHYQLARLLHARGGSEAEAKRQVLQALEDAPRFRQAQVLLLEIEPGTSTRAAAR